MCVGRAFAARELYLGLVQARGQGVDAAFGASQVALVAFWRLERCGDQDPKAPEKELKR